MTAAPVHDRFALDERRRPGVRPRGTALVLVRRLRDARAASGAAWTARDAPLRRRHDARVVASRRRRVVPDGARPHPRGGADLLRRADRAKRCVGAGVAAPTSHRDVRVRVRGTGARRVSGDARRQEPEHGLRHRVDAPRPSILPRGTVHPPRAAPALLLRLGRQVHAPAREPRVSVARARSRGRRSAGVDSRPRALADPWTRRVDRRPAGRLARPEREHRRVPPVGSRRPVDDRPRRGRARAAGAVSPQAPRLARDADRPERDRADAASRAVAVRALRSARRPERERHSLPRAAYAAPAVRAANGSTGSRPRSSSSRGGSAMPEPAPPGRRVVILHDEQELPAPVFVLAPARSFTSVVCAMLGQHPQLYALPETNLLCADTVGTRLARADRSTHRTILHGLLRAVAQLEFGAQTATTVGTCARVARGARGVPDRAALPVPDGAGRPTRRDREEPEHGDRGVPSTYRRDVPRGPVPAPRAPPARARRLGAEGDRRPRAARPTRADELAPASRRLPAGWTRRATTRRTTRSTGGTRATSRFENFLRAIPADRQLRVRGEDVLQDPDTHLRTIASWLGVRTDDAAVDAMKHPENSPYAFLGPRGARFGNDRFFLEQPALRAAQGERPEPRRPARLGQRRPRCSRRR